MTIRLTTSSMALLLALGPCSCILDDWSEGATGSSSGETMSSESSSGDTTAASTTSTEPSPTTAPEPTTEDPSSGEISTSPETGDSASTTDADTSNSGETEDTEDTENTAGTSDTDDTESTTGDPPSEYCDLDPLPLDYTCDAQSDETVALEIPGGVVPPATTVDFELPISECGDATRAAAGFATRIRMVNPCLWSMKMALVCPAGSEIELTSPGQCAENCEPIPGIFDAVFQTTGSSSCNTCDLESLECYRQPTGEQNWTVCGFLDECTKNTDEPWKLRVTAGESPVEVDSIELTMALRSI